MYLEDKKHVVQDTASATLTTLTLDLATNSTFPKPESSSTSLSAIFMSCIFADICTYNMYKEFLNANDEI